MSEAKPTKKVSEIIGDVTGIKPKVIDEIWEAVKANAAKLDGCPKHDFHPVPKPPHKLIFDYRCSVCGGKISGTDHHWYARGVRDGHQQ